MSKPNISLLGATYSDVSGVTLPKSGGGTATFPWVEGSDTKTQNGTYDVTNLAELVVNVSGGGGASNIVTGTFKGTTTGAAMDVTIPYTGTGYPIALMIYPSDGSYNPNSTFYTLIQRYVIGTWTGIKCLPLANPFEGSTTGRADMTIQFRYKSSTSNGTSFSNSGASNATIYADSAATSSTNFVVRIRTKTKMSVFIANTSYGFAANIEYKYWVIYSS